MREARFEVLWYKGQTEEEALRNGDIQTKVFYTKKQALAFYEQHKNDTDKYGWWVTHRNADWEVIEDIIY